MKKGAGKPAPFFFRQNSNSPAKCPREWSALAQASLLLHHRPCIGWRRPSLGIRQTDCGCRAEWPLLRGAYKQPLVPSNSPARVTLCRMHTPLP